MYTSSSLPEKVVRMSQKATWCYKSPAMPWQDTKKGQTHIGYIVGSLAFARGYSTT